jgi:Mce-associated membrane protein
VVSLRKRAKAGADSGPDSDVTDTDGSLTLAEAEAAAAEAEAKAARARAEAIRLRQQPEPEAAPETAAIVGADADSDNPADDSADLPDAAIESATPTVESAPRSFWRPLRWVAGTLTVLAIAGLVTLSVLMVLNHQKVQARQERANQFIAAGRQGVVTLMSLNFNSIDDDIKKILDNSTGEFKEDFEGKAKDFSKVAKESKVITEASTTAAGLESMTDNDAVVLVAARTKVTNSAGAVQEPRSWRLTINLVREGDQIKMSKVDFAP